MDNELFKDFAIKKKIESSAFTRKIVLWLCHRVDQKDFAFTNDDVMNFLGYRYDKFYMSYILNLLKNFGLIKKHIKNKTFWIISSGSDYFLVKKYELFAKNITE
jgi:hypothetical protein